MDTCLRQIRIRMMPTRGTWLAVPELRSGDAAYQFLLEVTTGLRSAIPGETNVFGQFKDAWLDFQRTGPVAGVAHLAPAMHRLIHDTKALRQEHLEGIGGSSYGSLVRKLIAPGSGDRILFVGAGALARSMLPLFSICNLGMWNHRIIDAPDSRIERVFRPDQGERAASWADHVILTTPADDQNDANWQHWLTATRLQTVVHLGQRSSQCRAQPGNWGNTLACYDLDNVFALRRKQDDFRSDQLTLARAACRQRAAAYATADQSAARRDVTAARPAAQSSATNAMPALSWLKATNARA